MASKTVTPYKNPVVGDFGYDEKTGEHFAVIAFAKNDIRKFHRAITPDEFKGYFKRKGMTPKDVEATHIIEAVMHYLAPHEFQYVFKQKTRGQRRASKLKKV
jgi:hypothetical protein